MEFEVLYTLENEQQFWDELDDIVSVHCQSHDLIDNALRSYLAFTTQYKGEYLHSEDDIARCSYKLLASALFDAHRDYVRRQIVHTLLQVDQQLFGCVTALLMLPSQEDSADTLHLVITFLLLDGRQNETTFNMMNEEGAFIRLVELIQERKDDDAGLHRLLLELLYEMSRIQRLRIEDLILIEDEFITYMFEIIEDLSNDVDDPYHYPVIRVLLILNEQYMVTAHAPPDPDHSPTAHLTNKVIKILSTHGSAYKTFGENIILVLNRESETSLQLLILKLLYLLFTTPSTYEYFYTNDLRVLVDVMIRNLLDLPLTSNPLRHTYLRVLYPLLAHTQLKYTPHYKRDELLRLLNMMTSVGSHFGNVDETTARLVTRCAKVPWLREEGEEQGGEPTPNPPVAKSLLSVEQPSAMASALSVVEVAAHMEKPGVQTPSLRQDSDSHGDDKHAHRQEQEQEQVTAQSAAADQSVGDGVTLRLNDEVVVVEAAAAAAAAGGKSPFDVEGES